MILGWIKFLFQFIPIIPWPLALIAWSFQMNNKPFKHFFHKISKKMETTERSVEQLSLRHMHFSAPTQTKFQTITLNYFTFYALYKMYTVLEFREFKVYKEVMYEWACFRKSESFEKGFSWIKFIVTPFWMKVHFSYHHFITRNHVFNSHNASMSAEFTNSFYPPREKFKPDLGAQLRLLSYPDHGDFSVRSLSWSWVLADTERRAVGYKYPGAESGEQSGLRPAAPVTAHCQLNMKPFSYLATSACLLSSGLAQEFLFSEVRGEL